MEEPEEEILVAGVNSLGGLGVDAGGPLAGDPGQDVGVVGGQVDRHPDIADPSWKRPCPPRGDRVDRRQPAVLDQPTELQHGRVEALDMADLDGHPAPARRDHDPLPLLGGFGERLLDENRNVAIDGGERERDV